MGDNNFDIYCALGKIIYFFNNRGTELGPINFEDDKGECRFNAERANKSAIPGTITHESISRIANEIYKKSGGSVIFELDEEKGEYVLKEKVPA